MKEQFNLNDIYKGFKLQLASVPVERMTKEICELAFSDNPNELRYIPNKFKTYDMCKIGVISNPELIKYVPVTILTKQFFEDVQSMGVIIPKKHMGYVIECIRVNEKLEENIEREQTFINNHNLESSDNIPNEITNINIQYLSDFFSEKLQKKMIDAGITNLGQLINFSEKQEFLTYFKGYFDEISNTIRLLKCKYLNEDPLIDINDESSEYDDVYEFLKLLGLSYSSLRALMAYSFCKNGKEFFEKIKNPDAKEQLLRIRGIGLNKALEIIAKANIVIEYYEKKEKNGNPLSSKESSGSDDLTAETMEELNNELQRLYVERKKIDDKIEFILSRLQDKKINQSKGGVLK